MTLTFQQYNDAYKARHGMDYDKPGVHKLTLEEVADCEGAWAGIVAAAGT